MLAVFRSPLVPDLHEDDAKALHEIRAKIDKHTGLRPLRELVAGHITWNEFESVKSSQQALFKAIQKDLIAAADFVCLTPALSQADEWKGWKDACRGLIVDDAAAMHRADLYEVWGNVLTPCVLSGDLDQLGPVMLINHQDTDQEGNLRSRFSGDTRISSFEFFQGVGIPVLRLRRQLRMGKGLLDIIGREIYPDPISYAPCCDIDLTRFRAGHLLERVIRERFPEVRPPPEGTFAPLFVHCKGYKIQSNLASGSSSCSDQVKVALDLVAWLTRKGVPASDVQILTLSAANVEVVTQLRVGYGDRLDGMPKANTIEGYQGQ
jgi:hypothetical protein